LEKMGRPQRGGVTTSIAAIQDKAMWDEWERARKRRPAAAAREPYRRGEAGPPPPEGESPWARHAREGGATTALTGKAERILEEEGYTPEQQAFERERGAVRGEGGVVWFPPQEKGFLRPGLPARPMMWENMPPQQRQAVLEYMAGAGAGEGPYTFAPPGGAPAGRGAWSREEPPERDLSRMKYEGGGPAAAGPTSEPIEGPQRMPLTSRQKRMLRRAGYSDQDIAYFRSIPGTTFGGRGGAQTGGTALDQILRFLAQQEAAAEPPTPRRLPAAMETAEYRRYFR